MAKYNYSKKTDENSAKAVGKNLGISFKQSINVCNFLRGKDTVRAKKILNDAIALKVPIPFTRFLNGIGHRRGNIASGSYAPTTCKAILKMIETVEANAQYKGINSSSLLISHLSAQQGNGQWRYGRKRRQKMKSTHIELIVEENAANKSTVKTERKTSVPKKTVKPEIKKPTVKKKAVKAESKEKTEKKSEPHSEGKDKK